MNKLSLGILLAIIVSACNNNQVKKTTNEKNQNKELISEAPSIKNGYQLLETNCFSCHQPNPNAPVKLAPAIGIVKKLYAVKGISEEKFNESLNFYLNNPTAENSKIPEAIKQYGLMPKTMLNENQIRDISHYLFITELEKDNWFENEFPKEQSLYSISSKTAK